MDRIEEIGKAFEWVGVVVIVVAAFATLWIAFTTYRRDGGDAAYVAARRSFGRGLLISLEIFVAADLLRTISVDLTLEGIGALGLLVIIRTILSFSLEIELTGTLPWRAREAGATRAS
ncbi:MAG: DUF1622 domain-containing protein [Solirubrobacteraceae bacterium]|nr:DUF1622 domain-containing protein [Solirubrobacteraceae bacterium]